MDYIYKHLDKLLAICALAIEVVAPEKMKKWGIVFILLALFIFIVGLLREKQGRQKKREGRLLIVIAIVLIALVFFLDNVSDFDLAPLSEEQDESDQPFAIKNDADSDEEGSQACEEVSITDETFEMSDVDRALLYDDTTKEFPIWFKDDLQYNHLRFMVDNIGTSFADLKHAQFIVDDYKPITSKDVLLLKELRKGLVRTGVPPTAKAIIDLSNIANGKSTYDVDFFEYKDNETDVEIKLKDGQSFNIDPTSQTELILYPKLNKSGIYTYHLKIDSVYKKTEYPIETEPVSFLYIAEDSSNYEYDDTKLDLLNLESDYYNEELDRYMHYTINGRTLLIHDTEIIFSNNDLERYLPFINTIVIEEGTKRIEAFAFGKTPDPEASVSLYLPLSLEYLDTHGFDGINIEKQYYSGTEDQLDSILQCSDSEDDGEKRTGYEGK